MEWTREERYRTLESIPEADYELLFNQTANAPHRQTYHVQPPTGLLNDPNGFTYFNGQYHLFYQWFPLGPVHGLKYWYHTVSDDLATFENVGIAIRPDTLYDSHGAYSGSGIVVDDTLKLVYTGNHRSEQWERMPYQMVATMHKDNTITKDDVPIINGPHQGYTDHFRDPKVWYESGMYYAVIGAQREDETGTIVVYQSRDFKQWDFVSELSTDYKDFGFMWECPDYFKLGDKDVVLFCPQGIDKYEDQFWNIYQSGYIIGELDKTTFQMKHGAFTELDHGFDFYAPQTTLDKDGNRILIGWMGLPETGYPTDKDGWAHCLTLPRVLTIENNQLKQRPVPSLKQRRGAVETAEGYATKKIVKLHPYEGTQYELIVDVLENESTEFYIELRVSKKESTMITYNKADRRVTLDRFDSGMLPEGVDGYSRSVTLDEDLSQLQIFVDTSSIEIFINDGEKVMTTRIFTSEEATGIRTSTESGQVYFKFTKYDLKGA
ncbi:glycoside hydrolase family 32 protein [Macrococcoides caseolyticum]|uniref:glycoside hydrolase family 32 protein n=1 Tax=Macrococcoides caseolyticum TaxID=69966 RepID=UPI001F1FEA8F|nr:sucrose-6-phosphate hydrolase [Macrococcus caseolyticus]MCE4958027.1 sucrose-6-phosphate hydrolase [Macrococcus caseolyticus]